MKKIKLILIICIGISMQASAQNKTCNLMDGQLHNVYVFSKNMSHTIVELFGEKIHTGMVNIQYIKTAEQKNEIDSLCITGKLNDSTFIFPDKDAGKTMRFCNVSEYVRALKNKTELKIEEE